MKRSTFNKRAEKVRLMSNSIAYKELVALLEGTKKESRPDISTRNRVNVYTDDMMRYARLMKIDLCKSNDAPRGGIEGNYCYLSPKGKRQMFK